MSADEWTYAILLVVSVGFGFFFKSIQDSLQKQLVSSAVGLAMVIFTCGWHSFHSIITILVNILIISIIRKKCHVWSFVWCFSYLVFFRTTQYFGLPKAPAVSNAVQLLLTLKMVGISFEISDSQTLQEQSERDGDNEDLKLRLKYEAINPSVKDIICYAYCYIGLLTGPYFKFRTYHDMLYLDTSNINIMPKFLVRVRLGLFCTVVFLATSKFYWISYATTDEFLASSFLYKMWFMVPMFIWFRARMYAAWIISECVCVTSCLGAYPTMSKPRCGKGPTDLKALAATPEDNKDYDFETVNNIDVYGCEIRPSLRAGMRSWNMTVQYWLATYIYRRVPYKSIRTTVTMAVSAFWHGIHPGYYLSFMTVPLCQYTEDICASAIREKLSTNGKTFYDVIRWFFRFREFDYMCMGFLLLRFDHTMNFWSSIYFIVHINCFIWLLIGLIVKKLSSSNENEGIKKKES